MEKRVCKPLGSFAKLFEEKFSSSEKIANMAYLFNIKCISLSRKSGNSPKVLSVNCLPLFIFSG